MKLCLLNGRLTVWFDMIGKLPSRKAHRELVELFTLNHLRLY